MELFEHPFAILTAVFFFQVGNELALQPAQSRLRNVCLVLVVLSGLTLGGVLVELVYGCIAGFLLGFLVTAAFYTGAGRPTSSQSSPDRVNDR